MEYATALQAGEIAANIHNLELAIAAIQEAIKRQITISGQVQTATPPSDGVASEPRLFSFPPMTTDESAAVFQGAIAIFQARIDAMQAQLGGL